VWNPTLYLDFDRERTQPCIDLVRHIPIEPATLADLGCGPGNSTAVLRSRWPAAKITGVDSSVRMLAMARETNPDATWIEADIGRWRPDEPMDLLFSNAALQWAPGHHTLLPDLLQHLRPGGVLAVQIPYHLHSDAHSIIEQLCRRPPWSQWLDPAPQPFEILAPEEYYRLLSPRTASLKIWQTTYWHLLDNPAAIVHWMRATGLRPYLSALPDDQHTGFLRAYAAAIKLAYPAQPDGRALFPFNRLFLLAVV